MGEHTADPDAGDEEERLDAHLQDLEDGCGCTEVWEHTSAAREADARTEVEAEADTDGEAVAVDD